MRPFQVMVILPSMSTHYIELSTSEVAVLEGVTERTIRHWCREHLENERDMPHGMSALRKGRRHYVVSYPVEHTI